MLRWILAVVAVAMVMIPVSGCIVASDVSEHESGQRISKSTLKQFEPGETTKEWTVAVLGGPTSQEQLPDGTEILKYEHSSRKEQDTAIFLLFAGETDREERQTTYFEFKEGVLTRYWQEEG